MSPKQQQRPMSSLPSLSFFYWWRFDNEDGNKYGLKHAQNMLKEKELVIFPVAGTKSATSLFRFLPQHLESLTSSIVTELVIFPESGFAVPLFTQNF